MQERFTACRSRQRGGGPEDICRQLELVVRGCGEAWLDCHTPHEIRALESMHVEAMVAQWVRDKVGGFEDCQLYKQYRYNRHYRNLLQLQMFPQELIGNVYTVQCR
jgi:hypothetical protein